MLRAVDLFCGIGGFRIAFEEACHVHGIYPECVFSSDIDRHAQDAYETNFGERPFGNITCIDEKEIPDHDILFAGFPDWYKIVVSDGQARKQAGNAISVNVIKAVLLKLLPYTMSYPSLT